MHSSAYPHLRGEKELNLFVDKMIEKIDHTVYCAAGGGEEGVDLREQEGLPRWFALYFQSLVLWLQGEGGEGEAHQGQVNARRRKQLVSLPWEGVLMEVLGGRQRGSQVSVEGNCLLVYSCCAEVNKGLSMVNK